MKIGIQGEKGAYSEAAAQALYGKSSQIVFYEYFEDVFKAVKSNKVQKGVIPIENSLAGCIHQNYDLLQKYKLNIVGEIKLRVEHVLMCHPSTKLDVIREVRSHPQALSQCSQLFREHKKLKPIPFYDTAGAAKSVAENPEPKVAAIASRLAASEYGLKILKKNVENQSNNYTRFLGISKSTVKAPLGKNMKCSLSVVAAREESGVLFKMLGVFALRDINLVKIESRPLPSKTFEYIFYLDFMGNPKDAKIKRALEHLQELSTDYHFYGAYPEGKFTKISG